MKEQILITGGTGFIASRLIKKFIKLNYQVTILTRNEALVKEGRKENIRYINQLQQKKLPYFSIILNLAGESIAQLWTKSTKKKIYSSRMNTTRKIIKYIHSMPRPPKLLISASAVGYYGHKNKEMITERSSVKEENQGYFTHRLCKEWEKEALKAELVPVRVCLLRLGVVLAKEGGLISKLLSPFKWGLGGKLGDGEQWMSWIHIDDVSRAILHIIKNQSIHGAINLSSPKAIRNKEFTKLLSKKLNRPAFLHLPKWLLKLIMGKMAEELLLSNANVFPEYLEKFKNISLSFSF